MRPHPLPASIFLIQKLLEEIDVYLQHYTPLISRYRQVQDDARTGTEQDEDQYRRFVKELSEGGPSLIKSVRYLDFPFEWKGSEEFPIAQERWLRGLESSPDAPLAAAAAVHELAFKLQNDLLERAAELELPPKEQPEWLVGSRADLNEALGVSRNYPNYLEKLEQEGALRFERRGKKFAVLLVDLEDFKRAREKLQEIREG